MTYDELTKHLSKAIKAKRASLKELRSTIMDLLCEVPTGTILRGPDGQTAVLRKVVTGASQWDNRTWDVTIEGRGLIMNGDMACHDCNHSKWDGNNMHYRSTESYCLGHAEGPVLDFLPGPELRKLAGWLPSALASFVADCEAEAAANNSIAQTLTGGGL